MKTPVVVSCSSKYEWCLKPFNHLLDKYCPNAKVDIAFSDTPKDKWVDGFLDFLYKYEPSHFVLLLEDYWLCREVDADGIDILADYMKSESAILRIDLTADRLYAGGMRDICYHKRFDIIEAPDASYQMSLQGGLWNKKHLIEVLEALSPNHHSAWDVELQGDKITKSKNLKVYGVRQFPVRYVNGMNSGKPNEVNFNHYLQNNGLTEEDKQIIKTMTPMKEKDTTPDYTSNDLIDWLGYIKHDEAAFLKDLSLSLPENPFIVNIGAGAGTSALIFLESRPDLTSCTVDIQKESSPLGCLEGEMNALKKSNIDLSRHEQIHGDSKEICKTWAGKSPDLVFIDGDHTYDGCKGDIEGWLPLLKKGGILAIHDYEKTEKAYSGVNDSVNELLVGVYHKIDRKTYSLVAFKNEKI